MKSQRIKIKLKAYDRVMLDKATSEIIRTAKRTGAKITGPVPLPTRKTIYTVLRSPHVNKKSREQFEIRTHKRLIYVVDATPETIDSLTKVNLSAGVNVELKVL